MISSISGVGNSRKKSCRCRSLHRWILTCSALSLQAADQASVAAEVLAELGLHLGQGPVDDLLVDVAAAQVRVAAGAEDLDGLVFHDPDDRDVERAAAEVEHDEGLRLAAVKPIGDGRGRRLIDDQAGD